MRTMVFGAGGFIGRHVDAELTLQGYEVIRTFSSNNPSHREGDYLLDMGNPGAVNHAITDCRPDIIINCAGREVAGGEGVPTEYRTYSEIILEQLVEADTPLSRLVIIGSAGEYGPVSPDDLPVAESTELNPLNQYGIHKAQETRLALEYAQRGLPVTVARSFNAIGVGMPEKQFLSRVLQQLREIQSGEREVIEVTRRDSTRDYFSVRDLARGVMLLATSAPEQPIYNLGSGVSTSNGDLIDMLASHHPLLRARDIQVIETADTPEAPYASRADITLMRGEFDWSPVTSSLDDALREIAVRETVETDYYKQEAS